MLVLIAFGLACANLLVALALATRVRRLTRWLDALERRERRPSELERGREAVPPVSDSLAGLRVRVDVVQDHPHPVFANLLKEALVREAASPLPSEGEGEVSIFGSLVCNGYADVYYRAEIRVSQADETLFTFTEKPPHGDRPENLARETVARLKAEMEKHERQRALRELGS